MNSFLDDNMNHIEIPLSGNQLVSITNDRDIRIVPYHDLKRFNNVNDLFNGKSAMILLHESTYNSGHYICLLNKIDNRGFRYVEIFDSYGLPLEETVSKFAYERKNYLRRILENSKNTRLIKYYIENNIQYQEKLQSSQVCGRYACFRYIHQNLTMVEFNQKMKPIKSVMKYDVYITLLTDLNVKYNI